MFRTFARLFLPNPFDRMLKKTARKGGKKVLLGWNRGLGDIALGLYAMVHRIRALVPDVAITFITRENLRDGFSLLDGVNTIVDPSWKRGEAAPIDESLKKEFDLVIERPNPTDWVRWQLGHLTPRLKWDKAHDALAERFPCPAGFTYIGVQVAAETNHGPWRDWPFARWQELLDRFEKLPHVKVLLFGFGDEPKFLNTNVIDLRGKTNLFELLSIVKNRCSALVLPDSGIASMTYYIDESFPIRMVTLWADPGQGILKQRVLSPNPQLVHCPLVAERRDLSSVTADAVMEQLFPANVGCIILAGGQGTRLGVAGPKGTFSIGGKSLFQWICEKVPHPKLPVAVMTSPLNHEETVAFFEKNRFFGLEVHFFQQEMHPFLDEEKRPLAASGPNGNGSVFRSFVRSGLADLFAKRGIDLLVVSNIDNLLTDPFDADLIACVRTKKADVAVKCIERTPLYPSMGMFVGKRIVEYTDLDPEQEYRWAYTGQMAFTLPFFRKMAEVSLPLHWVRKKHDGRWVWKGEQFLFDSLPFAAQVEAVVAPCETCYAPVKSQESVAQIETYLRERCKLDI